MKKTLIWLLAIVLTLSAAIYQRITGPTYPFKVNLELAGKTYKLNLPRSHGGADAQIVKLDLPENFTAKLLFRRYPTSEPLTEVDFERDKGSLVAYLPGQPPAGKLEYYVKIFDKDKQVYYNANKPVIIRYKGKVPAWVLLPHIIFMFTAMLLSTLAGLLAVFKEPTQKKYGVLTLILLLIGGGILGPIVQKFAFGEYWTGIPYGWDLTDNKTLIALIFWIVAVIANRKKQRPVWTIIAALMLIVVYSIPHSLWGSQLDPNTGKVIQGFLLLLLVIKEKHFKNL